MSNVGWILNLVYFKNQEKVYPIIIHNSGRHYKNTNFDPPRN